VSDGRDCDTCPSVSVASHLSQVSVILSPHHKSEALRDGDVHLFFCLFVCLSVAGNAVAVKNSPPREIYAIGGTYS